MSAPRDEDYPFLAFVLLLIAGALLGPGAFAWWHGSSGYLGWYLLTVPAVIMIFGL